MARSNLVELLICICLLLGIGPTVRTAQAAVSSSCATDGTIEVCVPAAAVAEFDCCYHTYLKVSVTLKITNKTSQPLSALIGDDMSFEPKNAPGLTPIDKQQAEHEVTNYLGGGYFRVSGMALCANACNGERSPPFTTLAPGHPLTVQISYLANGVNNIGGLLQSATLASFSATLREDVGGKQMLVPLPSPEFPFGNGLAGR